MILISTLSEITKDNDQVFSVSEDSVVSVPDEFLCVAVDEAQESFQRFMTSSAGQTVTSLLKLKNKTHYWYVRSLLNGSKFPCRALVSATWWDTEAKSMMAALSFLASPSVYSCIEEQLSKWYVTQLFYVDLSVGLRTLTLAC